MNPVNYSEKWQLAMTYAEYRSMTQNLLAEGRTTGADQSEAMVAYAQMNEQRSSRLERTFKPSEATVAAIQAIDIPIKVLCITEGWCGDAAQSLPILERLAQLNDHIETRYLLRDEHLDLMDAHLTNGARAIPKCLRMDAEATAVSATWGPRPATAHEIMRPYAEAPAPKPDKAEYNQKLHLWYGRNRGVEIAAELVTFFTGK